MFFSILIAFILLSIGYIFTFTCGNDFYLISILSIYLLLISKIIWQQNKSLLMIDYIISLIPLIIYYLLFKKDFILSNCLYLYLICFICNAIVVNRQRFMYLLGKNN